jgi:dephospho-CoA kinase
MIQRFIHVRDFTSLLADRDLSFGLTTYSSLVLGLTGNLGSGKSTAGLMFADRGFARIDCDEIVRDLLAVDRDVLEAIRYSFGPDVFDAMGQVDRKRLGAIVFSDTNRLNMLEKIVHPRVLERWREAVATGPEDRWVVEIPLLFEKNLQKWVDLTICLACDRRVQLERLIQRGMTPQEADQRIAVQLPLNRKIELADIVLLNDGGLSFLSDQIDWLIRTPKLI